MNNFNELYNCAKIYNSDNKTRKYTCPNCGAAIEGDVCLFCGTAFLDFACIETDKPFFMKIKCNDGIIRVCKVRLASISTASYESSMLYADDNPIYISTSADEINMTFILM